jgi:hypothetical protein
MLDEVDEDAQNAALEVPPAALSDRRLLRPALPSISLSPAVVAAGARGAWRARCPWAKERGDAGRGRHGQVMARMKRPFCGSRVRTGEGRCAAAMPWQWPGCRILAREMWPRGWAGVRARA